MDKQIDESDPQQPSEQRGKMVAPEDVTYSQHDEKKEAKQKNDLGDSGHANADDETYLDKEDRS